MSNHGTDTERTDSYNAEAGLTPSQLNLGLLLDNPEDELFDNPGGGDDHEEPRPSVQNSVVHEPRTTSQPQINYNMVNNDDLESMHGDDNVRMSDNDDKNVFPMSSDDEDNRSRKSYSSDSSSDDDRRGSHSYSSQKRSEDTVNRRRQLYMQIKSFCKRKDMDVPSHLHQGSSHSELKSYLAMLRSEQQMEQSVDMCKKVIVGCSSIFEYLNTRFDPIGLKMIGLSENISDARDDLTEPLEEIYEKNEEMFQMSPEAKLMMILGGAAAQTHIMNTMTGNGGTPTPQKKTYSAPPQHQKQPQYTNNNAVSDPRDDDDQDIQDILREMNSSDTRSNSSLRSSNGTIARQKRGQARINLSDL
jgi:hypothetical protein